MGIFRNLWPPWWLFHSSPCNPDIRELPKVILPCGDISVPSQKVRDQGRKQSQSV